MCIRSVQSKPRRTFPCTARCWARGRLSPAGGTRVCHASVRCRDSHCLRCLFLNKTVSILPSLSVQSTTAALGVSCVSRVVRCPTCRRGPPCRLCRQPGLGSASGGVELRHVQWRRLADVRTGRRRARPEPDGGDALSLARPGSPLEQDGPRQP